MTTQELEALIQNAVSQAMSPVMSKQWEALKLIYRSIRPMSQALSALSTLIGQLNQAASEATTSANNASGRVGTGITALQTELAARPSDADLASLQQGLQQAAQQMAQAKQIMDGILPAKAA